MFVNKFGLIKLSTIEGRANIFIPLCPNKSSCPKISFNQKYSETISYIFFTCFLKVFSNSLKVIEQKTLPGVV